MQPADAERFQRFARATEWPLGVLALLIVPAILLDDHTDRLGFHEVALWLNWIVWLAFCGELAVKAWLSPAATTVGYGDISPTTTEGRLIAVLLMLVGIGAISILTATVASFFFEQDKEDRAAERASLERRLASLETKQDQVLEAVNRFQRDPR
jgi:type VI protein secretion system component VasK